MMYMKAKLFGDTESMALILKAKEPREQKTLGRAVKGFIPAIWNAVARDIVFRANVEKFSQNKRLLFILSRR